MTNENPVSPAEDILANTRLGDPLCKMCDGVGIIGIHAGSSTPFVNARPCPLCEMTLLRTSAEA